MISNCIFRFASHVVLVYRRVDNCPADKFYFLPLGSRVRLYGSNGFQEQRTWRWSWLLFFFFWYFRRCWQLSRPLVPFFPTWVACLVVRQNRGVSGEVCAITILMRPVPMANNHLMMPYRVLSGGTGLYPCTLIEWRSRHLFRDAPWVILKCWIQSLGQVKYI